MKIVPLTSESTCSSWWVFGQGGGGARRLVLLRVDSADLCSEIMTQLAFFSFAISSLSISYNTFACLNANAPVLLNDRCWGCWGHSAMHLWVAEEQVSSLAYRLAWSLRMTQTAHSDWLPLGYQDQEKLVRSLQPPSKKKTPKHFDGKTFFKENLHLQAGKNALQFQVSSSSLSWISREIHCSSFSSPSLAVL